MIMPQDSSIEFSVNIIVTIIPASQPSISTNGKRYKKPAPSPNIYNTPNSKKCPSTTRLVIHSFRGY